MEDFVQKTPESKALLILDDYEGSNNYILNLKHKKQNSKSFVPTRPQADYINNYHTLQPKVAKKWVKLDSYFGKKLMEDKMYFHILSLEHQQNTNMVLTSTPQTS